MRSRKTRVDDTVITITEDAPDAPRVPELIWHRGRQAWCSPEVYDAIMQTEEKARDFNNTAYGQFLSHHIRNTIPGFPGFNIWWG